MINMKICIIVSTFPPYKGGMGNSAYEFAKILGVENDVTVFMPSFCHSERSGATAKRSEESIIDSSSLSHPASQAKRASLRFIRNDKNYILFLIIPPNTPPN